MKLTYHEEWRCINCEDRFILHFPLDIWAFRKWQAIEAEKQFDLDRLMHIAKHMGDKLNGDIKTRQGEVSWGFGG